MKLLYSASFLALAVAPAFAIPPENFGFPSAPNDTALTVAYQTSGNTSVVQGGELFGAGITADQPMIAVNTAGFQSLADYNGTYLVLMVDPDAPYPEDPTERFYLHWAAPNMTKTQSAPSRLGISGFQLTNSTPYFVDYTQPAPPDNSSAHRYILYAFEQPDNFSIPSSFDSFTDENRAAFNLTSFISDAGLSDPAAAMYYYVSNETDVPQDFVAEPGGTYPGGNGDAITSGPGPSVTVSTTTTGSTGTATTETTTTTGTGSSASATATGSSSSSSAGAAPMATAMGGLLGAGMLGLAAVL